MEWNDVFHKKVGAEIEATLEFPKCLFEIKDIFLGEGLVRRFWGKLRVFGLCAKCVDRPADDGDWAQIDWE